MQDKNQKRNFYTISQFIDKVGIEGYSRQSVYSLIRKHQIPSTKLGVKLLIPAYFVEDFCAINERREDIDGTQEQR